MFQDNKLPLSHYDAVYDPAKAHDYYIRTRKLHPRQKGARQITPNVQKERAAVAAEVSSLQKKLSQLNSALKVAVAKERKPKLSSAQAKTRKTASAKKYRSAHKSQLQSKAKATAKAKATKAAYQKVASGGSKSGGGAKGSVVKNTGPGSVAAIKAAIAGVQKALVNAKARQKALG